MGLLSHADLLILNKASPGFLTEQCGPVQKQVVLRRISSWVRTSLGDGLSRKDEECRSRLLSTPSRVLSFPCVKRRSSEKPCLENKANKQTKSVKKTRKGLGFALSSVPLAE